GGPDAPAARPRRYRLGYRASGSGGSPVDPHLRRHPRPQGRLRYRTESDRSPGSAQGRARPDGHRGRAEPRRSAAVRPGDAEPPDPHPAGDARAQVAAALLLRQRTVLEAMVAIEAAIEPLAAHLRDEALEHVLTRHAIDRLALTLRAGVLGSHDMEPAMAREDSTVRQHMRLGFATEGRLPAGSGRLQGEPR